MAVPTVITDLSTTIASNSPAGSDSPASIDDFLRAHAGFIAQLRDNNIAWGGTGGGTVDVITITPSPAITAYAAGQRFSFISSGANTTNVTLNVNGLGAKAVTKNGAIALAAGDIPSGAIVTVVYDGTRFQIAPQAFSAGADIASAATLDLTAATGNLVRITGTTATTAVTLNNGQYVICYAVGAWPLTYHATNLPVPGSADYTCAAGDMVIFSKDGSGEIHVEIVPVSLHPAIVSQAVAEAGTDTTARLWTAERVKQAIAALSTSTTLDTPQATTSGTSFDYSIPSTAKCIAISLRGVSLSGTSYVEVQLGDSGGIETSGYSGAVCQLANAAAVAVANISSGFALDAFGNAAVLRHGTFQLVCESVSAGAWSGSGVLSSSGSTAVAFSSGTKVLTGTGLTTVRIKSANGTDTFDAGEINVAYW